MQPVPPVRLPLRFALSLLALSAGAACSGSGAAPAASSEAGADVGAATGADDSGEPTGPPGDGGVPEQDASADAAGTADGAPGSGEGGTADSGARDIGSCCSEQSTPGCDDPNLEVCVCEKDPSCCTTAWSLACALIVQQKYCQPGVRDCVCGTDAGEWAQTQCCSTDWTSTCDSVATLKCNAVQGCF